MPEPTEPACIEPIDYLAIGHVTEDLTPAGPVPGGTVTYAALTARAFGLRVGIVTVHGPGSQVPELEGVQVVSAPSPVTTTFENVQTPQGRVQRIHARAVDIDLAMVPKAWRQAPIVHLGPVAREVDPELASSFPDSFVGLTPQGWLRQWDERGRVSRCDWRQMGSALQSASAAVLSIEDVRGDELLVEQMAAAVPLLVVTEGPEGARVYAGGELRRYRPPKVAEVDTTGAGDIFAASFFVGLSRTGDPGAAAELANEIAARSVTRRGLAGPPTREEAMGCLDRIAAWAAARSA
jgi:hypothetical protein